MTVSNAGGSSDADGDYNNEGPLNPGQRDWFDLGPDFYSIKYSDRWEIWDEQGVPSLIEAADAGDEDCPSDATWTDASVIGS